MVARVDDTCTAAWSGVLHVGLDLRVTYMLSLLNAILRAGLYVSMSL